MGTACGEMKFTDDSMIDIDTIAVENEIEGNQYVRSELVYLIYITPQGDRLVLQGAPETELKAVTKYRPFENRHKRKQGAVLLPVSLYVSPNPPAVPGVIA